MPLRVLIADHDSTFVDLVAAHSAWKRITLSTAATGLECLDKLRSAAPDVLVLDPNLLWGNGAGVLAAMAEDPALASIPVIIVCNPEDNGSISKVEAPQVREYMTKPVSPLTLLRAIRGAAAPAPEPSLADSSLWLGQETADAGRRPCG